MELLTLLCQYTTTHISDHIHEWRRRRRLVKAPIPDHLLANWFCKSLLLHISKDIGISSAVIEDQCIRRAQHLDLIYSQSGTLYYFLPNAPGNPNPLATQKTEAHANGLIGAISGVATKQSRGQASQPCSATTAPHQMTPLPPVEVNSVQTSQKPSRKNKKNKKKTSSSEEQ